MAHDLGDLSEYLSEFTTLGDVPTSLGGYGFGAGIATAGAAPAKFQSVSYAHKPQLAATVQRYLNALQAKAGSSGRYDKDLQNGWATYVKVFQEPQSLLLPAEPERGLLDYTTVWLGVDAFKRLSDRAQRAAPPKKTAPSQTLTTRSTPSTPDNPASISAGAGDFVTSTASVQDILVRLGWRDRDKTTGPLSGKLTDGTYGATTAGNWAQSARKRKLDPYIVKKSADGKQVTVREKTFLALKVVADALVPPEKEATVTPTASTVTITEKRLSEVLGRLSGAPAGAVASWADLVTMYQSAAKKQNLDTSIAKNPRGEVVVNKDTWAAFTDAYDKAAPAPAAPKPQEKSAVDQAQEQIRKKATASTPAALLKKAFNYAIASGVIKREPFTASAWTPDYAPLLIQLAQVDGVWKQAWEQLLVVGKLVAKDGKSVKLYPETKTALSKIVTDYEAKDKASKATPSGFSKVNSAKIIEAVNKLSVSSKVFSPNGGSTELADALKTFLQNTNQTVGGDLVWVNTNKDVFVQGVVLSKLADATKLSEERAKATESYRKRMVEDALKASSASVTVDELQQAFVESVESGKASGDTKTLYKKVKLDGAFDPATQAAYTELARTLTIGPSVQQFQQLLQQQMGPNFKAALVTEVQNKVWTEFLSKAVSKSGGKLQLRTLPALAKSVSDTAAKYRSRKAQGQVEQEKIAGLNKIRDAAVKASNVIVSILDLQMAILRMQEAKDIGAVKTWNGVPEAVKLTAVGDQPTRDGLFIGFWPMIFPKGAVIPETLWKEYTDRVGLRVANNGVSSRWSGANYVALTQAAANHVSKMASEYIDRHGDSALRNDLAPVPLQNQELRLLFDNPSVVTVTRKKAPAAPENPAEVARKKQLAKDKKQLAELKKKQAAAAKKLADEKRAAADEKKRLADQNKSNAAAQEAARKAEQEAQAAEKSAMEKTADSIAARTSELIAARDVSGQGGAGGQASGGSGGSSGGGQGGSGGNITFSPTISVTGGGGSSEPSLSPPTATTEPAIVPTEPAPGTPAQETPVAPMEAGFFSGNMWLYMMLGGAGLYLLRDKSADAGYVKPADKKLKSRYSAPRAKTAAATRRTRYARTRRTNRGARRPRGSRP